MSNMKILWEEDKTIVHDSLKLNSVSLKSLISFLHSSIHSLIHLFIHSFIYSIIFFSFLRVRGLSESFHQLLLSNSFYFFLLTLLHLCSHSGWSLGIGLSVLFLIIVYFVARKVAFDKRKPNAASRPRPKAKQQSQSNSKPKPKAKQQLNSEPKAEPRISRST